jgi:hypothetical protein
MFWMMKWWSSQKVSRPVNSRQHLRWRSVFLMPPFQFAMACGEGPGLIFQTQFLSNRILWSLKRLGISSAAQLSS